MSATPHSRSLLLVDEPPILFLPRLAAVIGENDAIMLQQLHYWLDVAGHDYDGRRWIYNSYNEWAAQLPFWSRETVRRTLGRLRARGLVLTGDYNRHRYDRTLWYTIDYAALAVLGAEHGLIVAAGPGVDLIPPGTAPAAGTPPAASGAGAAAGGEAVAPGADRGGAGATSGGAGATSGGEAGALGADRGGAGATSGGAGATSSGESVAPCTPGGDEFAPPRGAGATPYGTDALPRGAGETPPVAGDIACGAFGTTIPETTTEITSEITSEINIRERERDGAPSPSGFEHFTTTETLTGWWAAECARFGVPVTGIDVRSETDKWRDEIRAGRRAVPADAAADWRQWMRRALAHYQRYPPPSAPPVAQPLASRGVPTVTAEELAAQKGAAAARLRELVLQRQVGHGLPPPQPAPRAAPAVDAYTAFRNRTGALFGRAPTSAE